MPTAIIEDDLDTIAAPNCGRCLEPMTVTLAWEMSLVRWVCVPCGVARIA